MSEQDLQPITERERELFHTFAEFRRGIRSALFPFWPNNFGVGDDEIIDAVRRAVEAGTQPQDSPDA